MDDLKMERFRDWKGFLSLQIPWTDILAFLIYKHIRDTPEGGGI